MKNEKTYELVLTALFTAIIVIMAFTPLGYIPLVVINATVIHIPVILGALFLGHLKQLRHPLSYFRRCWQQT